MSQPALLTTRQVSQIYGINEGTLRYWRHRNEGPQSFSLGKKIVYRPEDVDAWLAHQQATTSRGGVTA